MSRQEERFEPFRKDKFDTWKIQVRALLIKSDSWKYVNGSCNKPASLPSSIMEREQED